MFIALDIGGTYICIAASEKLRPIELVGRQKFLNSRDYEADMTDIVTVIRGFSSDIEAISIATPGDFNATMTGLSRATYVPQWVDKPFVETLATEFSCPVILNHDAEMGGLGVLTDGADHTPFVYIALGTGIGAVAVSYTGEQLQVRRIIGPEREKYFRAWQDDCGGKNVEQKFGKMITDLSPDEWTTVAQNFARHLRIFLEGFRPERIVFGGGIGVKQWPHFRPVLDAVRAENPEFQKVEMTLTEVGEDAPLFGALTQLKLSLA